MTTSSVSAEDHPRPFASYERVASTALAVLVLVAPFEALKPVLRVPGQSLSSVEIVLIAVLSACLVAGARARVWQDVPRRPAIAWAAFIGVAIVAALLAPEFQGNAVHMAARLGIAGCIWGATAVAARSEGGRLRIVHTVVVSGLVVALLVIADFAGLAVTSRLLAAFRAGVAVVGAQVRASGPFQYPTIASMYLEIAFALGLGVLVSSRGRAGWRTAGLVCLLAIVAEATVLTFTRAGLLTMAGSVMLVGALQWRGPDRKRNAGLLAIVAVILGIELVSSRSAEMLMLRLTSEGQGRWFSAVYDVPSSVTLDTRTPIDVPLTITNTGRATWDSDAAEPIALSYHWVANDSDEVVAWEGIRTPFAEPVRPGRTVSLTAQVGGPGRPGRFRLMWDIEQEHRLWFSTEPDAVLAFSNGTVTGPVTARGFQSGPRRIPRMAVRPGRLVLWSAAARMFAGHPVLGVGPDNYRLVYGRYSTLKEADPRVHSNNMYIEVLAGTGLVGAVAFAWVGLLSARAALGAAFTDAIGAGVAAACGAIAVHGLVDSFLSFTGTYILIAVTLGLASAYAPWSERHAYRV